MSKAETIFGNVMATLIVCLMLFSFFAVAWRAYTERSIASLRFLTGVAGRGEAMTEFDHLD